MTGDQVVNTAIGWLWSPCRAGSTADAVDVVAVTEIGGSGLAGMDHGALGISDVLFNLRDYGEQSPVAEEPSMQPVMCKLEPWNYNIT